MQVTLQALSATGTAVSTERQEQQTYIRVISDLLDSLLIEVTRVSEQRAGNVVGVLEAAVDGALLQIASAVAGGMDILDPGMVIRSLGITDVLLEDNDVGVWDFYGIDRGQDRSSILMDGADIKKRRSGGQQRQKRESCDRPHGDDAIRSRRER
jgi:hypothetical protein